MAIVIADTSPLQYLFQVGLLDLLHKLFGVVQVPEAVRDELQVGRSLGFHLPDLAEFPWISIRSTTVPPAVGRLELGPGESAALALALQTSEGLVLLDDAAARAAATQLGLSVTGTLGILLLAKETNLLQQSTRSSQLSSRRGFASPRPYVGMCSNWRANRRR